MTADLPENVCGRPARAANFVGRTHDLARLWARLETDHVLLTAPRRVGKTSVMFAMQEAAAQRPGWRGAVYLTAEAVQDELDFVVTLFVEAAKAPGFTTVKAALDRRMSAMKLRSVESVSVGALAVALRERPQEGWAAVAAELEQALRAEAPGGRLLILVDELPVFLLRLLEAAPERARAFLAWFRALRQGEPGRPDVSRWLLAGSIGLGPLATRHRWTALINDVYPEAIGAFRGEDAARLLLDLSAKYRLGMTPEVAGALVERIGWPIPYFLQLFVGALREMDLQAVDPATTERAIRHLLTTNSAKHFGPWWERLHEELGPTDAAAARRLLSCAAVDATGASAATLTSAVANHWGDADREDRRRALLEVLEHDGYLVHLEGRWRFRSPLLREAWLIREAR